MAEFGRHPGISDGAGGPWVVKHDWQTMAWGLGDTDVPWNHRLVDPAAEETAGVGGNQFR